jgi:uncharacterized glyoxalase superfamily protein PhnB
MKMSQFEAIAAVPVVNVDDIGKALAFYVEQLGFTKVFEFGPYAGVQMGAAMVHLNGGSDQWNSRPTSVRVTVQGVDEYYRELNERSLVKPDEHLQDTDFGQRQFSVLDPSENRITFAQTKP